VGGLLQELKRRNVFRVGAAYVVVAWLILQVIETVSEPLGLPDWTEAFFIVLLAAGFPLVLIFAWAFELTPEGLKKTKEVDRDESVTADTGKKLNYAIIGVLVVALGYFVWERQGLVEAPDTVTAGGGETTETHDADGMHGASVAVLPFVNMSADPEQEYFSDGISEELLNLLAKIPDLRVPARTSSFQFKGQNLDIADVARQLNVAHVLEGSVRKADVRIRVTAQLIEAETGYHLWSDTYDRELTDIFAIQDEISASIVDALSDTLGIKAEAAPHVEAAANPDAYNAFLFAQHLIQKRTKSDIEAAITHYETAIQLDPDYAPAHAGLGLAWRLLLASRATYGTLSLEASTSRALPHLERALELDPDLPEALGAMGLALDAQERYEEAISYYERALAINPSQTDIRNWYSDALSTMGRERDSVAEIERAYQLDPLSLLTMYNYAVTLVNMRQLDTVEPVLERLSQMDPARGASVMASILSQQGKIAEGAVEVFRGVDLDPSSLRLTALAAFTLAEFNLYDDALVLWPYPDRLLPIVNATGDVDYALELAQRQFEDDPTDPGNVEALAWAYYWSGDTEQGLKNAQRYLDSLGDYRRAIDGANRMFVFDAWRNGDREAALQRIEPLEADVDNELEAGVDNPFVYYSKAVFLFIRGETQASLDHLDMSRSRGMQMPHWLARNFDLLGWNDLPDFAERRRLIEDKARSERAKFLAVACGPDGFSSWQPSAETCAEVESI
jgi:TolB-like protein